MQNLISFPDKLLNSVTMYRLLVWGLGLMMLYAIALAFAGVIPFGGMSYVFSAILVCVSAWVTNVIFTRVWRIPANTESWAITAFILFFLLFPAASFADAGIIILATVIAVASKFLFNYKGRHIFNPAAAGAAAIVLFGGENIFWWVATPALFIPVLVLGLLVVRKVRKFGMFSVYVVLATALALWNGSYLYEALVSFPILFFASIMLTEPLTMPGRKYEQYAYAALTAVLPASPEVALCIANGVFFAWGLRGRLRLTLVSKAEIAKDIYEFVFSYPDSDRRLAQSFTAGQYMDWTIADPTPDLRGNRRYFTIASSPTEARMRLGIRVFPESSTFKKALCALEPGAEIFAGTRAGDFILPKDKRQKLVFIAGGIGVTPFRSMLAYLLDTKEKRDIVLVYCVKSEDEVAYRDVFERVERELGIRTIIVPSDTRGYLTEDMILAEIIDYPERMFYLSGPHAMVDSYTCLLKGMGVKSSRIRTDYFPGF